MQCIHFGFQRLDLTVQLQNAGGILLDHLADPLGFSAELSQFLPLPDTIGESRSDAGDLAQGFQVESRQLPQVVGVGEQLKEPGVAGIACQGQQAGANGLQVGLKIV